ncbi:MAG: 1-acyl-sn-glycerol-3-phosphate acyltransferase [Chitinophagaceae bacterium]
MTTGLRFFFRHIYVTGLENIPSKGPVIIIANHNSSLMDAALLGILLKRKAFFFARGDVFVNKAIQKILWWFHMMPVHSHQGGRNTLKANSNSFSDGQQILSKGGIIVFFPESNSHIEHKLLPFRKGVFRLAFDTASASNFSFDIPIVPVGISYDHPVACRTDVQVHAGKPLLISDYKNEYTANPAVAILQICKDAQQAIVKLILHIADNKHLQTAEHYLTISRNNNPATTSAWKIASPEKLEREKIICNAISNTADYEFENKQVQAGCYFDALSADGVTDKTVSGNLSFPIWKKLMLWAGFPLYLAGLLLNGLPVLIARRIADKKVYRKDFYSWIFVACYSFMYLFWLAALLITCLFFGWQYAIMLLAAMIITGLFAYAYKDWLKDNNQQKKWKALSASSINELRAMRNRI